VILTIASARTERVRCPLAHNDAETDRLGHMCVSEAAMQDPGASDAGLVGTAEELALPVRETDA